MTFVRFWRNEMEEELSIFATVSDQPTVTTVPLGGFLGEITIPPA